MKKLSLTILLISAILLGGLICYHSIGWCRGDVFEYIQSNFWPEGSSIVSGDYLASGEDSQGGFLIYRVVTEDGTSHYIRLNVTFHRYLTKIGPDFKIRDICVIPYYGEPTDPEDCHVAARGGNSPQ